MEEEGWVELEVAFTGSGGKKRGEFCRRRRDITLARKRGRGVWVGELLALELRVRVSPLLPTFLALLLTFSFRRDMFQKRF